MSERMGAGTNTATERAHQPRSVRKPRRVIYCDICGYYPGEVLYWRFDPSRPFSAPPVAGLLLCRRRTCHDDAVAVGTSRAPIEAQEIAA